MINRRALLAVALVLFLSKLSVAADVKRGSVSDLFGSSHEGIVVVAHRGCHNPAPKHGFGYAPENSLLALERCAAMGADMMETDVQMTADGYLVMIHDDSVERTTDGHGVISAMTLAEVRKLRLRQNLGGYAEPLTDEHVPTLDEMLKAAKGRITLNLDVKAPIYAEVVDAVVRAGDTDLVTVKTRAGIASPALAAIAPFNQVPFVPVLNATGSHIAAVAERQATNAKPVAFELPHILSADVPKIVAVGRQHGIKLFSNTLGDGFCIGIGGDNDALKNPDAIWGWLYRNGISIFQTDRPEALLEFRAILHK
jgi:glycerophosphoryl diester phosphodiesterase